MVDFTIPLSDGEEDGRLMRFTVDNRCLLFAGSRHITLPHDLCHALVERAGSLEFGMMTGCASGVDRSFSIAIGQSQYKERAIVACAFRRRMKQVAEGLCALHVVPLGLPPKVALAKRTLWMTNMCTMLVLFPAHPMGPGSRLAFASAIMNEVPVFVVQDARPPESDLYGIYPSDLFGLIKGFWCVPPVYQETGLCYEAA